MYFGAAQDARIALFELFGRFFARVGPHAAAPIARIKKPRRAAALRGRAEEARLSRPD